MRTMARRPFAAPVHDCNTRRMSKQSTATVTAADVSTLLHAGGEVATYFDRAYAGVWQQPHVPATTLELCRLRLARLHEVAAEIESPAVTRVDAHKRAAVLAGSYARAMDAQAITDELAAAVVEHVGEPGLVALIEALGFIDGRMRLARMLGPLFQGAN